MSNPSNNELILLRTLWRNSSASAREIHDMTHEETKWTFSSTRKTLDRMQAKNLVKVRLMHGMKVYEATQHKLHTLAGLINDFSKRILKSDAPLPSAAFTGSELITPEEVDELEEILKTFDEKQKGDA